MKEFCSHVAKKSRLFTNENYSVFKFTYKINHHFVIFEMHSLYVLHYLGIATVTRFLETIKNLFLYKHMIYSFINMSHKRDHVVKLLSYLMCNRVIFHLEIWNDYNWMIPSVAHSNLFLHYLENGNIWWLSINIKALYMYMFIKVKILV